MPIEWLREVMQLAPGMRVIDPGSGRGKSSFFLAREFGVEVRAVDLWMAVGEVQRRVRNAGVGDRVIPQHADARSLPCRGEFFDAIVSVDVFSYFRTENP